MFDSILKMKKSTSDTTLAVDFLADQLIKNCKQQIWRGTVDTMDIDYRNVSYGLQGMSKQLPIQIIATFNHTSINKYRHYQRIETSILLTHEGIYVKDQQTNEWQLSSHSSKEFIESCQALVNVILAKYDFDNVSVESDRSLVEMIDNKEQTPNSNALTHAISRAEKHINVALDKFVKEIHKPIPAHDDFIKEKTDLANKKSIISVLKETGLFNKPVIKNFSDNTTYQFLSPDLMVAVIRRDYQQKPEMRVTCFDASDKYQRKHLQIVLDIAKKLEEGEYVA